tara:strand:+ start:12632 stop:14935 length:2304 start_codon:yes stop_codon:yes gene_type:complete
MASKIIQVCVRITIFTCLFITINDLLSAQEPITPAIGNDPVNLIAFRIQNNDNIEIDGRLDETSWAQAIPITDFTQQEPVEGGVPSENTDIRVVYDDHAIYIGATLYDDPDGILAFQKQRDGYLSTDDRFMFILDTFLDGRTGYFFETNASGVMSDALITGGTRSYGGTSFGGTSRAWDGIWQVKTFIRPDGWSLEIRIPFRTLNFNPDLDTWGINFQRTIRRKNEEILWRGHRRNQSLRQPVHAGRLTGLRGMSQGIGLEAVPYAVANWKNVPQESKPTSYPRDIGIDINYNITPGLKAGISVNTDFAEAEVDQRRINLTRFPLRFPERRDFFLEGSSVFNFAPSNGADPYFSRKIGLREGEQIPINYASRLGGQVGKYELGFIHVNTAQIKSATTTNKIFAGEDFTVARVKRGIFEQSTIGAIYTRRSTGTDPTDPMAVTPKDQHTLGTDLYYRTSRLFGDKNFIIQAFAAWNSNPDRDVKRSLSDLTSRGIRLNYPNDIWSAHISYREFGNDYKPSVGFVTRNGFRRAEPRIGWRPRPNISWVRRFDFSIQFRHLEDIDTGITEERQWRFKVLGIDLESQDNFDIDLERQFDYLDRTFEISEGIFVGEGQYTNWEWSIRARTARRRMISGNLEIRKGGFWGGERTQLEFGIDFRPSPGILISADIENNKVDLPEGYFDANLFRIASEWSVTPLASITGNIQYDDVSGIVGLFMRTRWILNPGNELFLVFTQNWQNLGSGLFDKNREFLTLSRGGSVKINYSYRF